MIDETLVPPRHSVVGRPTERVLWHRARTPKSLRQCDIRECAGDVSTRTAFCTCERARASVDRREPREARTNATFRLSGTGMPGALFGRVRHPQVDTERLMITKQQVESVLNRVRPFLQSDGGNIELVAVNGNSADVRLTGMCAGCPSALMTLHVGVEVALRDEIAGFETLRLV